MVVQRATALDLTTLDRMKLRLNVTDTTLDDYLTMMIPAASRRADNYCNRTFAQQTYQDMFRPESRVAALWANAIGPWARGTWGFDFRTRGTPIVLRQAPVRQIQSFTEDDNDLTEGTDYELDAESGILYRLPSARPFRLATVSYVAGYGSPPDENPGSLIADAPDVEWAVTDMLVAALKARNRDSMQKAHEQNQSGADSWFVGNLRLDSSPHGAVPQGASDILCHYILPREV